MIVWVDAEAGADTLIATTPKVFGTLNSTPSIRDIWQLHRNVQTSAADNAAPELTANDQEACRGQIVRLSIAPDAQFCSLSIPSKGSSRSYSPR